jgi:hypothetical protein
MNIQQTLIVFMWIVNDSQAAECITVRLKHEMNRNGLWVWKCTFALKAIFSHLCSEQLQQYTARKKEPRAVLF